MKTRYIYTLAASALLAFTSCSDDTDSSFEGGEATISVNIADATRVQSGAAGAAADVFENNDKITITSDKQGKINYTLDNGRWTGMGNAVVWPSDGSQITLSAVHPADAPAFEEFIVPADQSTAQLIASADYMESPATAYAKGSDVVISMTRKMARVRVTLVYASGLDFDNTRVEIFSASGSPVRSYNAEGSTYTALFKPAAENTSTEFVEIFLNKGSESVKRYFINSVPALEAGRSYNFTIQVGNNSAVIQNVTITPWTDNAVSDNNVAEEMLRPHANINVYTKSHIIESTEAGHITPEIVKMALGKGSVVKFKGLVNKADMAVVKVMPEVQTLNLSDAQFVSAGGVVTATLEDEMFLEGVQTEVIMPDYLESLGAGCFNTSKIIRFTMPLQSKQIPEECFYYAPDFSSLEIPSGCNITEIGSNAFAGTTEKFTSFTIPSTVTTLSNEAFAFWAKPTMIIPETVTTIGWEIFNYSYREGLRTLVIKTKKEGSDVNSGIVGGIYTECLDYEGSIDLILDDSWFGPLAEGEDPKRQPKDEKLNYADGVIIEHHWMGEKFRSITKLSESSYK